MSHNKGNNYDAVSSSKKKTYDRFIPHTIAKNLFNNIDQENQSINRNNNTDHKQYHQFLNQTLFQHENQIVGKILRFNDDQADKENISNMSNINKQSNQKKNCIGKQKSRLPKQPFKILDAPLLKDDFYLNLVDWSDKRQIGVGLQSSLYIWSGCASRVSKAVQFKSQSESICSLSFLKGSSKIALGLNRGQISLFDIQKQKMQLYFGVHLGRVGSVGTTTNLICSGGRDGYVSIRDIRQEDEIFRYRAHQQEICGLKMGPAGDMVATGGNDNKLHLFSLKRMQTMISWSNHRAAVKAIGFNPNDASIASGGGSADRKIRIFSLNTFQMMNQVDTGSQICNLMYSSISNELVTTHGYSLNQINLWKWGQNGSLEKIDSLMGHKKRVLYLAGQNHGNKIVTGAGDEELRLWKVFDKNKSIGTDDLR